MESIIFLAGTPEYKILKEIQPLIKQALLHSFQAGYQCGEWNVIDKGLKESSEIPDMIEDTERIFEKYLNDGRYKSVIKLIIED
jgi:hypothetical protein